MRAFIAIEIPEDVKTALADFQKKLKDSVTDVRWINIDNIHLTLKFLGDTDEKIIDSIIEAAGDVCSRYNRLRLVAGGAGVFPNMRAPRVLWIGIQGDDTLIRLQADIEDCLVPLGFKAEKRSFRPHLTLGRFKSSRVKRLYDKIEEYKDISLGEINAGSLSLIRSELTHSGARYTRIAEIPLKRYTADT